MPPLFVHQQRQKDSLEDEDMTLSNGNGGHVSASGNVGATSANTLNPNLPLAMEDLGHFSFSQSLQSADPSSNSNTSNSNANTNTNSIRKYLVLLQDCVAIKFVSAATHHSHQFPFAYNSNFTNGNSLHNQNQYLQTAHAMFDGSSTTEVDHSLHGLYLYKGFREANLKCYWNATLCEAVRSLEYKGYIVPSTILVYSIPQYLTVISTAWSRKMLRNPPGFVLDFVGEIEELIAEPIQQGQFAPLSDSLCWAILELTSTGQEAFVDSILNALVAAFPAMAQPGRELVYQTLEKLIRDRKVYQTSRGYFVVTPDTFRYMNSSGNAPYSTLSTTTLTLDALMSSYYNESDKLSLSQHSWESGGSTELIIGCPDPYSTRTPLKRHNSLKIFRTRDLEHTGSMGARSMSFRLSKSKSLTESDRDYFRQRSLSVNQQSVSTNMKISKTNTPTETNKTTPPEKPKEKKGGSFFSKLFSFRRSKSKPPKEKSSLPLELFTRSPKSYPKRNQNQNGVTAATQTNGNRYPSNSMATTTRTPTSDESESGRFIFPSSDSDYTSRSSPWKSRTSKDKWSSLPAARGRSSRSRKSILDGGGPFYESLTNHQGPNPSQISGTNRRNFAGRESSRCSTLSQGTSSLGYGSQGPLSSGQENISERRYSPSSSTIASGTYASISRNSIGNFPSMTTAATGTGNQSQLRKSTTTLNSNRNLNEVYRRRHPSQTSQTALPSRLRPKSAYELLRREEKSTEALSNKNNSNGNSNANGNVYSTNPYLSSTTVTQNVKSTTSTELELMLPIGKLMSAAIKASRQNSHLNLNGNNEKITVNLDNVGGKVKVKEPTTQTEVKTTIDNNGIIETQFDYNPKVQSVTLMKNKKASSSTGDEAHISSNSESVSN